MAVTTQDAREALLAAIKQAADLSTDTATGADACRTFAEAARSLAEALERIGNLN